MNHLETYSMARPANVHSTRELLKLAVTRRTKQLNYISTLSIFNPPPPGTVRVVDEYTPIEREHHSHANGYLASKWVSEKMMMIAGERGIPYNIFRLGLVWADSQQGRYDQLQREYRLIKTSLLLGYGIRDYRYATPPTPVDYAANAVVSLARRHLNGGSIFHIPSSLDRVCGGIFEIYNRIAAQPLKLIGQQEWIYKVRHLLASGHTTPIAPLIHSESVSDQSVSAISFEYSRTLRNLELDAVNRASFDEDLLYKLFYRMARSDADLEIHFSGGKHYATQ